VVCKECDQGGPVGAWEGARLMTDLMDLTAAWNEMIHPALTGVHRFLTEEEVRLMTKPMEALERALDQESLNWLLTQHPQIAEAIEGAVRSGATPQDIKRAVIRHTQRVELALRCEQAARWLVGE